MDTDRNAVFICVNLCSSDEGNRERVVQKKSLALHTGASYSVELGDGMRAKCVFQFGAGYRRCEGG